MFVYVDQSLILCTPFSIHSMLYQIWIIFINFKTFEECIWELEHEQTDKPNALTFFYFVRKCLKWEWIEIHYLQYDKKINFKICVRIVFALKHILPFSLFPFIVLARKQKESFSIQRLKQIFHISCTIELLKALSMSFSTK